MATQSARGTEGKGGTSGIGTGKVREEPPTSHTAQLPARRPRGHLTNSRLRGLFQINAVTFEIVPLPLSPLIARGQVLHGRGARRQWGETEVPCCQAVALVCMGTSGIHTHRQQPGGVAGHEPDAPRVHSAPARARGRPWSIPLSEQSQPAGRRRHTPLHSLRRHLDGFCRRHQTQARPLVVVDVDPRVKNVARHLVAVCMWGRPRLVWVVCGCSSCSCPAGVGTTFAPDLHSTSTSMGPPLRARVAAAPSKVAPK